MNILFLGDSITDCSHSFSEDNLGYGYVRYTAEQLRQNVPEFCAEGMVINGGSDGFTFPRILQKWKAFYRTGHYDIVVILCGINEVGVIQNTGMTFSDAARYLDISKQALLELLSSISVSGTKHILVCEPFLFTEPSYLLSWKEYLEDVRYMIRTAVSSESSACYVPTQTILDRLCASCGISAVTTDGIHLTDRGHASLGELIFRELCVIMNRQTSTFPQDV